MRVAFSSDIGGVKGSIMSSHSNTDKLLSPEERVLKFQNSDKCF